MKPYLRLLHPLRAWRRASTRQRLYLAGLAVFTTGELGGLTGLMPKPVALTVFALGCVLAATLTRPADRRHS